MAWIELNWVQLFLSNPFFPFQEVFEEYKIESTPVFMFFRDGLKVCPCHEFRWNIWPLCFCFHFKLLKKYTASELKLFGHFLLKTHLHITKYQSWHNRICIEASSCATFEMYKLAWAEVEKKIQYTPKWTQTCLQWQQFSAGVVMHQCLNLFFPFLFCFPDWWGAWQWFRAAEEKNSKIYQVKIWSTYIGMCNSSFILLTITIIVLLLLVWWITKIVSWINGCEIQKLCVFFDVCAAPKRYE